MIALKHLSPKTLKPAAYNPRKMGDVERAALARGIAEFGLIDPIVARAEDLLVLGGHQRLLAAIELGLEKVPVALVPGLDDDRAAALNILLNNPRAQGAWDMKALSDVLSELDGHGFDATLTGFSDSELEGLLTWTPDPGEPVEEGDVDLTPPKEPESKLGEVYELGRHRLMCGDATAPAQIGKLLRGVVPQMVYTDPPYGVSIVGKRGMVFDDSSMRAKQIMPHVAYAYAPIAGDDSTATAIAAYRVCASLKIPVLIFWGANYYAEALPPSSCWIVWDKNNGESFFGDAELAWTNQKTAVRIFKHTWNGLIKESERGERRVHPTQKPVALAEWCFEKYGERGGNILDLFGGSGSSLIAAERMKRTAYVMELSPAYCDVIRRRYEAFVAQKQVAA